MYVDGEAVLSLPEELVLRAGLSEGTELTAAELGALRAEEARWTVKEAALRLLARRSRTRAELARSLGRKGFEGDVVGSVLDDLTRLGLVDDRATAAAFVRDRIRSRPRGRRRLTAELRRKGLEAETAEDVIETVYRDENASDVDLARDAARRWQSRRLAGRRAGVTDADDRRKERQRLWGYLARRGFSAGVIGEVIGEVMNAPDESTNGEREPSTAD